METRGADVLPALRFLRGLPGFLRSGERPERAHERLSQHLARREATFGRLLAEAVFERPASPYRRLLDWAGVEYGDVVALLETEGVDETLRRLHEVGVHVGLDEFKGARPLTRPGLEVPLSPQDFDNPLVDVRYEARTGGSTRPARRVLVDLRLVAHESVYHASFLSAAGILEQPLAIWHPAPPAAVGIKTALIQARLSRPAERWFSQTAPRGSTLGHGLFTAATVLAARAAGTRVPLPRHVPAYDAVRVARWLGRKRDAGTPATLVSTPSAAVRACAAAANGGLDIAGTFFVLVGEPYTAAKAEVVAAAGGRAASHYAMVESGLIGVACARGAAPDDVHLALDKVATILRPVFLGDGSRVGALFHTTLLPASPKMMLNVQSGDTGVLQDRDCGCGVLPDSFGRHLHTIRSYEKLTTEGANFIGDEVLTLVEKVLPARFGGLPTDYQFVEKERAGLAQVSLVVSPSVGELDGEQVVAAVLDFLRRRGETVMAGVWAGGRTLQLVRGRPYVTPAGKTPPLQTLGGS
jgi:hypothetical protein